MATDAQSLLGSISSYLATGNVSGVSLLKLALLQQIAQSLNPMADTTAQGLLSQDVIGGYSATSNASTSDLLELGLLNIIATALGGGSGGVGGVVINDFGGAQPAPDPLPAVNTIYIDTSGGQVWAYNATDGTWTQLIA
jgi:hypothetical protein